LFLSATNYFYIAYRLITMLLLGLIILFLFLKKQIKLKGILLIFFFYIFLIIPIFPQFFSSEGKTRLRQQSDFLNSTFALKVNEKRALCYLNLNKNTALTKVCYAFWNKPVLRVEQVTKSLLAHFSPKFLFSGERKDGYDSSSDYGSLYFFLFPWYFLGLFVLVSTVLVKRELGGGLILLVIGLLLGPLPSALVGDPSFYRATPMLPFLIIVVLLGIELTYSLIRGFKKQHVLGMLIFFLLAGVVFRYITNYFLVYTKHNDLVWHYDIDQIMGYVNEKHNEYEKIIFSDLNYNAPVLTVAFYQKTDPYFFLSEVKRRKISSEGVVYETELGKYQQGNFNIEEIVKNYDFQKQGNILFITVPIKKYSSFADKVIYDRYHSLRLAEIYDIEKLKKKIEDIDSEFNLE